MAYTRFQRRCIELGLCIQCGENAVTKYRRCMKCRRPKRSKPTSAYFKRRYREKIADRRAKRGYWPDIHGEI
jgi:hypothetical protein